MYILISLKPFHFHLEFDLLLPQSSGLKTNLNKIIMFSSNMVETFVHLFPSQTADHLKQSQTMGNCFKTQAEWKKNERKKEQSHREVVEEDMTPFILNISEDNQDTDNHAEDDGHHHYQPTVNHLKDLKSSIKLSFLPQLWTLLQPMLSKF